MGKGKPLTALSLEALQTQKNLYTRVLGVMLGVALVSLGAYLYLLVYCGQPSEALTLYLVPFLFLSTTGLPVQARLSAIRREITRREEPAKA